MANGPHWGEAQRARCVQQFNLFMSTQGEEGWDPDNVDPDYIIDCFLKDDICRPFLNANLGGHQLNKNSDKGISGYCRCACEYYVSEALKCNRRNRHDNQTNRSAYIVVVYLSSYHPVPHSSGRFFDSQVHRRLRHGWMPGFCRPRPKRPSACCRSRLWWPRTWWPWRA